MPDQKAKRTYKPVHCEACCKNYMSNYMYEHKKSGTHIKRVEAKRIKNDLLYANLKEAGSSNVSLRDQLIEVVDKLQIIIKTL
jgi:hypothetical protein